MIAILNQHWLMALVFSNWIYILRIWSILYRNHLLQAQASSLLGLPFADGSCWSSYLACSQICYAQKRKFSDTNFEIGKSFADILPWWILKHSVVMLARFSDLKVGIRELSFPFVLEPTEEQPLLSSPSNYHLISILSKLFECHIIICLSLWQPVGILFWKTHQPGTPF